MKITKQQQKRHDIANELIHSIQPGAHRNTWIDCPLCSGGDDNECCDSGRIRASDFIFTYWMPGAEHSIGKGGIFFTPPEYALSVAWVSSATGRVLEPTAGIGVIAHKLIQFRGLQPGCVDITCIEQQPKFVEIGKRLIPEATWLCGDTADILPKLPMFDSCIGNPPFGRVPTLKGEAHYLICSLMCRHTKHGGVMLLPANAHDQQSTGDKPSTSYSSWSEDNEGWHITETAFVGPEHFNGCSLKTSICELWKERIDTHKINEPNIELDQLDLKLVA